LEGIDDERQMDGEGGQAHQTVYSMVFFHNAMWRGREEGRISGETCQASHGTLHKNTSEKRSSLDIDI
jgi:hypothetical protein